MQRKTNKNKKSKRPKRGRPKTSSPSRKAKLGKLRVQEWRKRKRQQQNLVPVEVWIPKRQRDALQKMGTDLSTLAQKAFSSLITGK